MDDRDAVGVTQEQKARLHEVAGLMLEIYRTLAEMRHLRPESIIEGPHDLTAMDATYEKLELDPAVVYLYRILPFVDTDFADGADFFQGGMFFNQVEIGDVTQGRDPFHRLSRPNEHGGDIENGEYMSPWYTPLSKCGNHSPVMIYDTRQHRIWIVDQILGWSTDPRFSGTRYEGMDLKQEEPSWGDSGESVWSDSRHDEGSQSDGSSEFWNDEETDLTTSELDALNADIDQNVDFDEGFVVLEGLTEWERRDAMQGENKNTLEIIRSRNATAVLQDVNRCYLELTELPGQGCRSSDEWRQVGNLKQIYLRNGWRAQFDGEAFMIDLVRTYCAERAKYFADIPLQNIARLEQWLALSVTDIERLQKEVKNAEGCDREWQSRFLLWQAKQMEARCRADLSRAQMEAVKLCPGGKSQELEDLPLWECEKLRVEAYWRRRRLIDEPCHGALSVRGGAYSHRREIQRQHNQRKAALYEKAFAASLVDTQRLCPGKTFESATGIQSLDGPSQAQQLERQREHLDYLKKHVEQLREFLTHIPDDAVKTRRDVEAKVKHEEDDIENLMASLKEAKRA